MSTPDDTPGGGLCRASSGIARPRADGGAIRAGRRDRPRVATEFSGQIRKVDQEPRDEFEYDLGRR